MTAPDQGGGVLFGPFGAPETATAPGQAARDPQAERDHAEFTGWMEAQGFPRFEGYAGGDMHDAFKAGMQAARDLAKVTGDGSLRTRITALAETWEGNPKLTEEGALLRDLGQILRDELAYSSDRPAAAAAQERPAPGELPPSELTDVLAEILAFLGDGIPPGDEFALQVAAWRKRAGRAMAALAVTAAERDDLAQQCDKLRNLIDEITHVMAGLGRRSGWTETARELREKAGLPVIDGFSKAKP